MAQGEVLNGVNLVAKSEIVPEVIENDMEEADLPQKNSPWKKVIVSVVLGVALATVVIGGISFLNNRGNPDLEIEAPESTKSAQLQTPTPTLTDQLSQTPYVNTVEGYRITPPLGWVVDDTKKESNTVLFLSPVFVVVENKKLANFISIETSELKNIQLEDQVNVIKKGLVDVYPDFVFEEDLLLYLDGRRYYLISGTYTLDGYQIKSRSLITIYNSVGYAVSAIGPSVNWKDFENVITESLYSFRVL